MPTNVFQMNVNETERDTMCVQLHPAALDADHIDTTRAHLIRLVAAHGCRRLRLDFGAIESVTSIMLAKLLGLHRAVTARGGQVEIDNVNPLLWQVFEITRLNSLFRVRRATSAA